MDARAARLEARAPRPASRGERGKVLVDIGQDIWGGVIVQRELVAILADDVEPPPGVSRLPGPGEVVLSPALAAALASPDGAVLRGRYGRSIGEVGSAGLLDPGELLAYVGATARTVLGSRSGAVTAAGFGAPLHDTGSEADARANSLTAAEMLVGALSALLVVLVAMAAKLAAVARASRLAALRLCGASARHCRLVVAGEIVVASTVGTLAGLGLFLIARAGPLGRLWQGPWYPEDLQVGGLGILVVAGTPVLSHLTAQSGLARAVVDPLGVRHHAPPPPPRAWSLIAFLVGVVALAFAAFAPSAVARSLQGKMLIAATFAATLLLPFALPAASRRIGQHLEARARRPSWHLALTRISDDPRRTARVASMPALAVIVACVVAGVFSTTDVAARDEAAARTGAQQFITARIPTADGIDSMRHTLDDEPTVAATAAVEETFLQQGPPDTPQPPTSTTGPIAFPTEARVWVGACADVVRLIDAAGDPCNGQRTVRVTWENANGATGCGFVACPDPGQQLALLDKNGQPAGSAQLPEPTVVLPWPGQPIGIVAPPAAIIAPEHLPSRPAPGSVWLLVRTDAQPATEDRVRDVVLSAQPEAVVYSFASERARHESIDNAPGRLRNAGLILALAVALAATVVAATDDLLSRRTQNGMLLAIGATPTQVWLPAAWSLVLPLLLAAAMGVLIGELFLGAMDRYFLRPFEWHPTIALQAALLTVVASTVIAGCAAAVIRTTKPQDVLRRE